MDITELRDRAALIAFQELLRRNEHGKAEYAMIETTVATAWDYAAAFIEGRPTDKTGLHGLENLTPGECPFISGGAGPHTTAEPEQ
jgi:hypothetical protein